MKKLIELLKRIFCKQDHTEDADTYGGPELSSEYFEEFKDCDDCDLEESTKEEECDTYDDDEGCTELECAEDEDDDSDEEEDDSDEEVDSIEEEFFDITVVIEEDSNDSDEEAECCTCDNRACILSDELIKWGANPDNLNYSAVMEMLNIKANNYDEVLDGVSKNLGKTKASISSSLRSLTTKAKFEDSEIADIKAIDKTSDFKSIIYAVYSWIATL